MNALTQSKNTTILIALTLAFGCFGLSPQARAVCQEGCLSNGNVALGENALLNDTGGDNTAIGNYTLYSNASGFNTTATGSYALYNNTTGFQNTANGAFSLTNNTSGIVNTAIGAFALYANTIGGGNTATGDSALRNNISGSGNTADGASALYWNVTGSSNTATGSLALDRNATGSLNTAVGVGALLSNIAGSFNTAIGANALTHSHGNHNIALGYNAGVNLNRNANIAIGNPGVRDESNTIRIGRTGNHSNTYIAGISGVTVAGGVGVIIDTDGHLGTASSSVRYKDKIKPMDKASEPILALKPVTFRYKEELDPEGIPQFGLVAEEVEKVDPDLVARDDKGKPYTVRYDAVNAMLLNEFIKEHRKVEEQADTISQQECRLAELERAVAELRQPKD